VQREVAKKRPYRKKARAEQEQQTRLRITEAAVALHGSVGPARTTVSEIAKRAGVERVTVYRHFPDEAALFEACSRHWLAEHPPPDPAAWARTRDPDARLARGLAELYQYYARTHRMWEAVHRDAPLVPALDEPMRRWRRYLDDAREILLAGWQARGTPRRRLRAALGHALDFRAWASLTDHGATREAALALMIALISAAAGAPRARRSADQ
jgi:AcrR family transcriptional regulator